MPQLFIILLKINLVLVLFSAAYYLVLRRLTFYTINRAFLVFGILFSSIYPFIDLTDLFQNQEKIAFVPRLNQQVTGLVPSNFITEHWQTISILFYAGVLLMGIKLVLQFVSLYKIHKSATPGTVNNFPVRILNERVSPFSFWQTIYINPAIHKERELKTILAHENIHIKEWHSLDIILAELSVVFYWFNPGVWLMKKAVKENLEFITDEQILKKGIDKKAYQYSLLDVGSLTPYVAIVNNFNLSDLKKRLRMMNAKRSSRLTLGRYLLVLPVLLLTTLAFTISAKDIKKQLIPIKQVFTSLPADNNKNIDHVAVKTPVSTRKKKIRAAVATIDSVSLVHVVQGFKADSVKNISSEIPALKKVKGVELRSDMRAGMPQINLEGHRYTGTADSTSGIDKPLKVENRSNEPRTVIGYPSKDYKKIQ